MQRPKTLLASGAGAAAANGLYKEEGLYKGVPKYVHENGQLWVLRYRLRSGRYWWYIADKDQLDVDDGSPERHGAVRAGPRVPRGTRIVCAASHIMPLD